MLWTQTILYKIADLILVPIKGIVDLLKDATEFNEGKLDKALHILSTVPNFTHPNMDSNISFQNIVTLQRHTPYRDTVQTTT